MGCFLNNKLVKNEYILLITIFDMVMDKQDDGIFILWLYGLAVLFKIYLKFKIFAPLYDLINKKLFIKDTNL